jgi:hypothetical protein
MCQITQLPQPGGTPRPPETSAARRHAYPTEPAPGVAAPETGSAVTPCEVEDVFLGSDAWLLAHVTKALQGGQTIAARVLDACEAEVRRRGASVRAAGSLVGVDVLTVECPEWVMLPRQVNMLVGDATFVAHLYEVEHRVGEPAVHLIYDLGVA